MSNQVLKSGWNLDDVLAYLVEHGATIDMDNDHQIIIFTDLYQAPGGALYDDIDPEWDGMIAT